MLRGLAVLSALGHGLLVGPERMAARARAAGVRYAAAPAGATRDEIVRWLAGLDAPDLRIVDVFPLGPGRELAEQLPATRNWLVTRLVRPVRYGPTVRAALRSYERVVWCEPAAEPPPELRGPTRIGPVRLVHPAVPRGEARRLLGAGDGRKLVLAIGAGGPGLQEATWRVVRKAAARVGAVARFASDVLPAGAGIVRAWPAAPLLSAADVAVVAAGYHAVLEVRAAGVPAVLVPQPRPWDDQHRRAELATCAWRRVADSPEALEAGLRELLDGGSGIPEPIPDGAAELAEMVGGATPEAASCAS